MKKSLEIVCRKHGVSVFDEEPSTFYRRTATSVQMKSCQEVFTMYAGGDEDEIDEERIDKWWLESLQRRPMQACCVRSTRRSIQTWAGRELCNADHLWLEETPTKRFLPRKLPKRLEVVGKSTLYFGDSGLGLPRPGKRNSAGLLKSKSALQKVLEKSGIRNVTVLVPNVRGVKLAIVVTDKKESKNLEKLGRFKIGFMCCLSNRERWFDAKDVASFFSCK